MPTISGTIQSIQPPDYQNQHGVHYQNITVLTQQGPITGRIGTKKPYTTQQNLNQQGQWDMESGPQGNKFKKHYDTPYQGGGYQGGQQNAPQTGGGPDVRGMQIARLAVLKAVLSATDIPLDMVNDYLLAGVQFAFTGTWSLQPRTSATPNPAMGGEEFPPTDIPY